MNITTIKNNSCWTQDKQKEIIKLNKWIAKSNADYKIDAYSVVEDPNNPDTTRSDYNADNLHLQQNGYYAVAMAIYNQVFR